MAQLAARYQANWRTFLRWARPYRGHLTGALALALLAAAGGLSLPLVARLLIFRLLGRSYRSSSSSLSPVVRRRL